MKTTKTVWSIFRDLVNSKSIGTEITRQEIIKHITTSGLYCFNDTNSMKELKLLDHKAPLYSSHTLDSMRNMSEKVEYLDKTNKSGIYRVVKHFAADYTVSQLRKDYDNGSRNNSNED